MKKITSIIISVSIAIVISLASTNEAFSQEYKALVGLESINAVFDFRKDGPKEVATYLNLIHRTFLGVNSTINENTDFVVVFTGPVVKLLSTNKGGFPSEEHEVLDKIAEMVSTMVKDGIQMEICLYAVKLSGLDPDSILPGIEQIGNGWLSLIGYQAKNYSLLPLY
jgi:intracellular sulfur oxidation DsrE/DsrF family protein